MTKKAEWVEMGAGIDRLLVAQGDKGDLNIWVEFRRINKGEKLDRLGWLGTFETSQGVALVKPTDLLPTKEESQTAIVAAAREFLQQALDALPEEG